MLQVERALPPGKPLNNRGKWRRKNRPLWVTDTRFQRTVTFNRKPAIPFPHNNLVTYDDTDRLLVSDQVVGNEFAVKKPLRCLQCRQASAAPVAKLYLIAQLIERIALLIKHRKVVRSQWEKANSR